MAEAVKIASIAILDDYQNVAQSLANWRNLQPAARTVFYHDHVADIEQLVARLEPFDVVVLTRERTKFGADLIYRLPNLKLIVTIGMANAAIDVEAATARGVIVAGTTGGDPHATPALTFALILALTRGLYREAASVRAGGWQVGLGVDISGKTLSLLGLGKIGQEIAAFGKVFGMRVIAWSQNLTAEKAAEFGAERVGKDELFQQADVLSVHLKLSERTRGIAGARELGLMKPTAYLVNTSRGPIVSEEALIEALRADKIAGAALDVFDEEPLPQAHPFRFLPNVLATPHIGYVTENTYRAAFPQIVENIQAWLDKAPIRVLTA
ncbi:MAG: D-2-hydroxyacid dehydrogenase family protein [Methylocella sp.]